MSTKGIKHIRVLSILLLICGIMFASCMTAEAASAKGWVKKKNMWFYYVNNKPVTGRRKIGKHEYYFDSRGVQMISWRKIGKDYYCFRSKENAAGYMLKNTTKNGIRLGADGKAVLSSERAVKKVETMVRVSALMDKIIQKNKNELTSYIKKLKACYDYLRNKYPYRGMSHYRPKDPNWDIWCVDELMKRGYADCHPYACTFAYLANAIGYTDITINTWYTEKKRKTGHSWVQINKKAFDVSLGRHNKSSYELFNIDAKKYKKKFPYYPIKARKKINEL